MSDSLQSMIRRQISLATDAIGVEGNDMITRERVTADLRSRLEMLQEREIILNYTVSVMPATNDSLIVCVRVVDMSSVVREVIVPVKRRS